MESNVNEEVDQEPLKYSSFSSSSSSKLMSSSQHSADFELERLDKSIDESHNNRLPGNDTSFEFLQESSDSLSPNTSIEEISEEQENLVGNGSSIKKRRLAPPLKTSAVQDKIMPLTDVPGVLNQQLSSSSSEGEFEMSVVLLRPGSYGSKSSSSSQYSAISESERFDKSIDESCSTRAGPKNNNSFESFHKSSASSSPNISMKEIIKEQENVVENESGITRRPPSLESESVKEPRVPLEDLTDQLCSINCNSQKGSFGGEFVGSFSKLSTSAGSDSSNSSSIQGSHDIRADPVRNTSNGSSTSSSPIFREETKEEQENVIENRNGTKNESLEESNTLPSMKSQPTKGQNKPLGDVTNLPSSRSRDNQNGSLEKTRSSTTLQQSVPHRVLPVYTSTMLSSQSDQEDS